MKLRLALAVAVSIALLSACQSASTDSDTAPPKTLTMIVINDTYRLDNFPYVRTLRQTLEAKDGNVLVVHAGDFLFPSMLSQQFNGAQMIDLFNHLDGDAAGFDPYFFVTFGNHEFDKAEMKHAPMLSERIAESQFDWLGSNVIFKQDDTGTPVIRNQHLVNTKLLDINGIRVGVIGAVTDVKHPAYVERFESPDDTLRRESARLRAQGAEIVVAVTHLALSQDMALLEVLGNAGPDVIAGGHEHDRKNEIVKGRHVIKADADAVSAAVVRITTGTSPLKTHVEFVDLPGKFSADENIQTRIAHWNDEFARIRCTKLQKNADCMQQIFGTTQVELVGEELTIRRFETNLGNFLTDTARDAYAAQGAQIAFINSGSMRLNYNIPAGPITRTRIDTLFAYDARLSLIKITGRQLQDVINHAITDWTGNGRWLQISGFAFRHNPERGTAEELSLITPQGLRPIKPDETLLAVTNDYLINSSGDQDGYVMLNEKMRVDETLARPDLKDLVITRIEKAGSAGIAPQKEGRICNAQTDTTLRACITFGD